MLLHKIKDHILVEVCDSTEQAEDISENHIKKAMH